MAVACWILLLPVGEFLSFKDPVGKKLLADQVGGAGSRGGGSGSQSLLPGTVTGPGPRC